jgi:hypothetical protein
VRYYVNGPGFTFQSPGWGAVMVGHGVVFDPGPAGAPAGWTPGPDSWNLFPMDSDAQTALKTAIAAQIARTGPIPPPGIVELNPDPPLFAP